MSWGGLVEIFNPGHRHLREEMDRKRVEAQIPGNEGDGTTQVDLENNVVRIASAAAQGAARRGPGRHPGGRRRRLTPGRVTLPAGAAPDGLDLQSLADRLTTVEGVVGVVLGGSRARGDHTPDSDVDLGIYYDGDLDIAGSRRDRPRRRRSGRGGHRAGRLGTLGRRRRVARHQGAPPACGDDIHVDWIYRDVERVREAWARAHRGAYDWNAQTGHPLGVPDFAYVGELALAVVLADPSGDLTDLRNAITYPDALRAALARNLWEADFLLQIAAKATSRGDAAYIALCLSRAMLLCAHALHAHDRRWLVNEKGAVAGADSLPSAPPHFAERVNQLLGRVGITPTELAESLGTARQLVDEVKRTCEEETP